MPSSLLKDIEKQINKKTEAFIKQVSEKFNNISETELMTMWNDVCGSKTKKTSNFQRFCKEKRPELKSEHPDLKFGDVNKRLGEMWKGLSDDEKSGYSK